MNTARRNARGEASVQRILDATVQLVGRYGYDNTTIARITKFTQLPASSIYWYFRDKDELIASALEYSYTRFARGRRSWQGFDPAVPLEDQLIGELEPELQASESEAPLRLGIMLALEGSAARSKIQEPFQRRRAAALESIRNWWDDVFAAFDADENTRGPGTWWMSTLTLALMDGHYISDVVADGPAAVAHRSRIVGLVLASAFTALRTGAEPIPTAELPTQPPALADETTGPAALLSVTRRLVAEHGYEGATIGRICSATGMQRSSVYWRYKDKDSLIKAAVAEPFLELLAPLHALGEKPWTEEVSAALSTTMRGAHDHPDTIKAGLLLKVQQWDPPTAGGLAVAAGTAGAETALAEWFAEALPPTGRAEAFGEHLAWTVLRLVEGLMLRSALGRPAPVEATTRLFDAMMDGVMNQWPTSVV
ncbi:TetR/AcrR family transcriptional regulator [Nocardia carnea]|uniref:TetR/AcrR family transcriptional regulator n=1 Tax=Nocardia carnea TaxID=37328 RepID=A0ABW7TDK5_9NOCA|nr:TetR/AcrR family transcriptional regulator [Nocardia carnea]